MVTETAVLEAELCPARIPPSTRLRPRQGDFPVPRSETRMKCVCLDLNGREFVRRVKAYARRHGLPVRFDPTVGKGSHGAYTLARDGRLRSELRSERV